MSREGGRFTSGIGWLRFRLPLLLLAGLIVSGGLLYGGHPQAAGHSVTSPPHPSQSGRVLSAIAFLGAISSQRFDYNAPSCAAILSNELVNASISQAYSQLGLGSGTSGRLPTQAYASHQISNYFLVVCPSPTFQGLIQSWGPQNFSLEIAGIAQSGQLWGNFTVTWTTWQSGTRYSNEEYWSDNVSNGSLSGPYQTSGPSISTTPSSPPKLPIGLFWEVVILLAAGIMIGIGLTAALVARNRRRPRSLPDERIPLPQRASQNVGEAGSRR